jgi:branched-chain amino acid transport system ATP-binding protein
VFDYEQGYAAFAFRGYELMLELQKIVIGYNATPVVHGVDLALRSGQIVALIGANGAGKSTIVKAISGLLPLQAGHIVLEGQPIEYLSTRHRVLRGIAHIPDGRQVFAGLSVLDNLRMGCFTRRKGLDSHALMRRIEQVCERLPQLLERLEEPAGNLSGGQQQMLAIARGLMSQPRMLILDEPSLGLAPLLVSEVFRLIQSLRDRGLAILLSEQNARMSLGIADYAYVVEKGRIALEGTGPQLLGNPEVAKRYLGVESPVGAYDHRRDLALRLQHFFADLRVQS